MIKYISLAKLSLAYTVPVPYTKGHFVKYSLLLWMFLTVWLPLMSPAGTVSAGSCLR